MPVENFDSYKSTFNALVIQRTRMPSGVITHTFLASYMEDRKKGGDKR